MWQGAERGVPSAEPHRRDGGGQGPARAGGGEAADAGGQVARGGAQGPGGADPGARDVRPRGVAAWPYQGARGEVQGEHRSA